MLKNILDKYWQFNEWERLKPRFMRLRYLDAWLDGKFYDCIPTSFDYEGEGNNYVKIHDRRPAIQHNLPKMIANVCSRKLFGGRHAPRLQHRKDNVRLAVQAFIQELQLTSRMAEVIKRGSVGSVLVLFQLREIENKIQTLIEVVKSRLVTPRFDAFGELKQVRLHYPTSATAFREIGLNVDCENKQLKDNERYWFIREIDQNYDCIYHPILEQKWNPVNGDNERYMKKAIEVPNPLSFLPAVWFKNQPGGEHPEGECTFESALNNFIEYDYNYSQTGRGLFYHAAPQLCIKGELQNEGNEDEDDTSPFHPPPTAGPAHIIRLKGDEKDTIGGTVSGSDAFLIDTHAEGLKTSLEFTQKLKHASLEQTSVARKDMESISGTMSGKAMELIDQEFLDLIQELRIQYCEFGYLPLLKKLCKAARIMKHPLLNNVSEVDIDGLTLQYPAMYTPDPQEFLYIVQALTLATGLGQKNPEGGVNGAAIPAKPHESLMSIKDANAYLKTIMDFYVDSEDVPVIPETDPPKTENEAELPEVEPELANSSSTGGDVQSSYPKEGKTGHINVMDIPF
jgi:hypothetical protein